MNTNDVTKRAFQFQKVMGADNFATHHSVSVLVINKFVFLPGCHSLDSPITLLPKFKKIYNFRSKVTHSETLTSKEIRLLCRDYSLST